MHWSVKRLNRSALPACDGAAPGSDSLNLPASEIEDLHVDGLNASIARSTEGARSVGVLPVGPCAPASLEHEYTSVERRVCPSRARRASINQQPASLRAKRIQARARLDGPRAKRQAPLLERERSPLTETLGRACDFACRTTTALQLRRQRHRRASRAAAVHHHAFNGYPFGQRPISQTNKEHLA
jgi:hypothetical protein